MDLPYGDEKAKKFITNVGIITTNGPHGYNIMACEWTHHVSYSPGYIAICISKSCATLANIRETKEFGINIASKKQSMLSSVAGGSSGRKTNKIKVAEALGFTFSKAKKIDTYMVDDCSLQIECKMYKEIEIGDHIMIIGEVIYAEKSNNEPLVLHQGKYGSVVFDIQKPSTEKREEIKKIVEKYKKRR
jgi:flavin reductase (DIM6/NTAB) family NADH-FMN oxidoreductase RutF